MLKNKEIIEKLTVSQKLSLLTKGRLAPEDSVEGVPVLFPAAMREIEKKDAALNDCPPLSALANSWNCRLISDIAGVYARTAKAEGKNAVITPECGVKAHPLSDGMTEDPYLSGKLLHSYAHGIAQGGVIPVLSDCSISEAQAGYMDLFPNEGVIRDYFIRPFRYALKENGGAITTSFGKLKGNYRDVNTGLICDILRDEMPEDISVICQKTDEGLSVQALLAGGAFLLNGSYKRLEDAYNNYLRLKDARDKGRVTPAEFDAACADGTVLSADALDAATDRFLSFASDCNKNSSNTDMGGDHSPVEVFERAAQESVVLLKNADNTLPLKAGSKIAIIGENDVPEGKAMDIIEILSGEEGFECVGYSQGYCGGEFYNAAMLSDSRTLASRADIILLLINKDSFSPALKANRLALIDELAGMGKKIIAVVCDGYALDTNFDVRCKGLLLMPRGCEKALIKILSGQVNPSGKLTSTIYYNADDYLGEINKRKDLGKTKIGAFFGYRGCDLAGGADGVLGGSAKYPFGFGLSYTTFSYSKIKADQSGVRFKVKNTGRTAGCEIVQVYIGKNNSDILRPVKELKGFKKIYLEPGQSTYVYMESGRNDYSVWDTDSSRVEHGDYTVYAGSSASDVRLKATVNINGERLKTQREQLSDYVQSGSNVINGGYTLSAFVSSKKRSAARIASSLTLGIAGVYDIIFALLYLLNILSETALAINTVFLVIINLLVPAAVTVLVLDAKKLKKLRAAADEYNARIRENETELSQREALEKLFEEEFAETAVQKEESGHQRQTEEDLSEYLDDTLTLPSVQRDLGVFMKEGGLIISPASVRGVLSGMLASRLLIIKNADHTVCVEFARRLSLFFATPHYSYCANGAAGGDTPAAAEYAMLTAARDKHHVHVACFYGVDFARTADLTFESVTGYANSCGKDYRILPKDKAQWTDIPLNLWFILVQDDPSAQNIPETIAKNAMVIDLDVQKLNEKADRMPLRSISVHQFLRLGADAEKKYLIGESTFKKIDGLEAYAAARAPYRIENKEWRRIERYVSAYLACGGEQSDAAGNVAAAKLLPRITTIIKEHPLKEEEDFASVLEKIFD